MNSPIWQGSCAHKGSQGLRFFPSYCAVVESIGPCHMVETWMRAYQDTDHGTGRKHMDNHIPHILIRFRSCRHTLTHYPLAKQSHMNSHSFKRGWEMWFPHIPSFWFLWGSRLNLDGQPFISTTVLPSGKDSMASMSNCDTQQTLQVPWKLPWNDRAKAKSTQGWREKGPSGRRWQFS